MNEKTDNELITLTLKEKDWYQYLVERYYNKLKRYVFRITGCAEEDAEDILQEVFLKTYTHLNEFDSSLSFSSWIYRICHNEALMFVRKRKVRPFIVSSELDEGLLSHALVENPFDMDATIDRKRIREQIREAMECLDEKYRSVLILKYVEEKDYREISDILKKPMGSVATLLNRGRKQLKDEVQKKNILP